MLASRGIAQTLREAVDNHTVAPAAQFTKLKRQNIQLQKVWNALAQLMHQSIGAPAFQELMNTAILDALSVPVPFQQFSVARVNSKLAELTPAELGVSGPVGLLQLTKNDAWNLADGGYIGIDVNAFGELEIGFVHVSDFVWTLRYVAFHLAELQVTFCGQV